MSVEVNGRRYARPAGGVAVLCIDGCDPAYLEDALAQGDLPVLSQLRRAGTWLTVQAAMPTFTNPNNVSIVTGAPPAVHGISGNHFHDPRTGLDVPMNERRHLRAPTILDALAAQGAQVAMVSAKHKLCALLAPARGICGSVERPGAELAALLPPGPVDIYSAEASLAVLDLGLALWRARRAELLYLSTTDYVQHKHPPGSPEARAFYRGLDRRIGALLDAGLRVALTADHGMNDKTRADGSPNVLYLGACLGPQARVTLPITDPYVLHHGALGGCAFVHLLDGSVEEARARLAEEPQVELVLPRAEAAARFQLPADRLGDLLVLAAKDAVLGKTPEAHQLELVAQGLRSHGSLHERAVPLILSDRVSPERAAAALHNWDAFALALG